MENKFKTMTAAEIAKAIYDCARENLNEYEKIPFDCYGYRDPRNAYIAGAECEDVKLDFGTKLTFSIDADFMANDNGLGCCERLVVTLWDYDDEEDLDKFDAYKTAICHELQLLAGSQANITVDF